MVKLPSKPPELAWRNITLRKPSRSRGFTASTVCAPSVSVSTESETTTIAVTFSPAKIGTTKGLSICT